MRIFHYHSVCWQFSLVLGSLDPRRGHVQLPAPTRCFCISNRNTIDSSRIETPLIPLLARVSRVKRSMGCSKESTALKGVPLDIPCRYPSCVRSILRRTALEHITSGLKARQTRPLTNVVLLVGDPFVSHTISCTLYIPLLFDVACRNNQMPVWTARATTRAVGTTACPTTHHHRRPRRPRLLRGWRASVARKDRSAS